VRLILVRHGESEGNARGVLQGHTDFGLSALGREQARVTAERLSRERIDRVVSSPLRRASETAEAIAERLGLLVEPEPGLMEYDIGVASGLTGAEIRERHPKIMEAYARGERPQFEGEEGRDVFEARLLLVLESLRARDETIVAVAHGGVVSALCAWVVGIDGRRPGIFQSANCSITELFTDRGGQVVIRLHNDTCHLSGLVTTVDRG
jgi:broad specificity phosphatase PhoE